MTLADLIKNARAFLANAEAAARARAPTLELAIEHDLTSVVHETQTLVHQVEKEIEMSVPQNAQDALDRIKALLSGASDQRAADAKTISDITAQSSAKDAQIVELTKQLQERTQERDNALSQLNDVQAALLNIAPAPAN